MVFTWERGGVVLQDGFLVRQGGRRKVEERYFLPLAPRGEEEAGKPACLRFGLLGMSGVSDEAFLGFANRFGLLGTESLDAKAVGEGQSAWVRIFQDHGLEGQALALKEQEREGFLAAVERRLRQGPPEEREALSRWREEARRLARVVILLMAAVRANDGETEDALGFLRTVLRDEERPDVGVWEEALAGDPPRLAGALRLEAARRINKRLAGRAQLVEQGSGQFALLPEPATLLEALYVQLAFLMHAGHPVRICADPKCGEPFLPNHGGQRYCSPRCKERHKKERQRGGSRSQQGRSGGLERREIRPGGKGAVRLPAPPGEEARRKG